MKYIFSLIFLIIFSLNLSAQTYWLDSQSPTNLDLKNVFFINQNTGWIAGDSGFIARTNNSGTNWTVQPTGIDEEIQDFYFVNERLGWAIAWEVFPDSTSYLGTIILKTTDGGNNWIHYMYSVQNIFMKTVYFIDSAKGFLAGAPLNIVYTTDAGIRWSYADTDTTLIIGFPIEELKFVNALTGYACGGFRDLAGAMWRTSNGGLNWFGSVTGPEPLIDLYIFNPSKVIAVGGDFEFGSSTVKTSNSGINWFYDTLGTFGIANTVDFRTPTEGWISLGIAQKFAFTSDTGNTWRVIYTPDSIPIFSVDFIDSLNGWAVGYNGKILKYNSTKLNIPSLQQDNIPESITLYQNYPNPFNPETNINYVVRSAGNISLKIFDISGKEIITLMNSFHQVGQYSIKFSASSEAGVLPSGIYFYTIKSENFSETKKMILLK